MVDRRYMALALSLGARGLGRTWPNPAVGCVLVRDGVIVGRGWTRPGGRPHAETEALKQAKDHAKGATAYVTLEPCAHTGKTPPCSTALINAGVRRVVVATLDPDPRVAGQGIAMLEAAGIEVHTGIMEREARLQHGGFLSRIERNRPWMTLKLATSFDGRIASASGQSQWITGPQARRFVHSLRARHDAVMVGGGTARADDPSLTVRDLGTDHQPVRIVVSRLGRIGTDGNLMLTARDVPVWLVHGASIDAVASTNAQSAGVRLIEAEEANGTLDLTSALARLAEAGLTRVFCEGGGQLAASLLSAGLVDELIGVTAGVVLGSEGTPAIGPMINPNLADAPRFKLHSTAQIGADGVQIWRRD